MFNLVREHYLRFINNYKKYKALKRSNLFCGLNIKITKKISELATTETFKENEMILKEGELGSTCYVILSGKVKVFTTDESKKQLTLAELSSPAFFGEQALLDTTVTPRNANIMALTNVTLLSISHQNFMTAIENNFQTIFGLRFIGNTQLIERLSKQLEIFKFADDNIIKTLSKTIITASDKFHVFNKGDEPDYVYYIIDGLIHIILDESNPDKFIELHAGQIFGELSFMRKQTRSGTAIVHGHAKLLGIPQHIFYQLYSSTPKLRELVGALNQVYESPARGIVSQYTSRFLGYETINTSFYLPDNRIIIASQIIGKNIVSISHPNISISKTHHYAKDNVTRDIYIADNKIVGATIIGFWDELSHLYALILDATPLTNEQIAYFSQHGSLKTIQLEESADTVCLCMDVSQSTIINHIQAGKNTLSSLCETTGAGLVCGSCKYKIGELLGNTNLPIAHISKIESLNEFVRIFHLKLQDGMPNNYLPGQYITLRAYFHDNWIERSYTLISIANVDHDYQIAIQLENAGAFSSLLFKQEDKNIILRIYPPDGKFIFDTNKKRDAVFIAGGIGVTPAIAFCRSLLNQPNPRRLYIDYSAHTDANFTFYDILSGLEKEIFSLQVYFRNTEKTGRLTLKKIKHITQSYTDADYYICGSDDFNRNITNLLLSCGIPLSDINVESFTSIAGAIS